MKTSQLAKIFHCLLAKVQRAIQTLHTRSGVAQNWIGAY